MKYGEWNMEYGEWSMEYGVWYILFVIKFCLPTGQARCKMGKKLFSVNRLRSPYRKV